MVFNENVEDSRAGMNSGAAEMVPMLRDVEGSVAGFGTQEPNYFIQSPLKAGIKCGVAPTHLVENSKNSSTYRSRGRPSCRRQRR
ncbi:unnamed protein product [Leuciscus chuanchicus]